MKYSNLCPFKGSPTGKTLAILAVVLASFSGMAKAQSMRNAWTEMPDTLVPILNAKQRADLLNLEDMGLKKGVENALDGKSYIDTLTSDFIGVRLTESSVLQMRFLPAEDDTLLCVARTYLEPQRETIVSLYSLRWEKIKDISFDIEDLVQKPDTMTDERFKDVREQIDPCLISATLFADGTDIAVSASTPNLAAEQEAVDAILVQRRYKWNGHDFQ